jgi:hypothetical protein
MQKHDPEADPDYIRSQLEKLRNELPPDQYAIQSARLIHKLKQLDNRRRYALT